MAHAHVSEADHNNYYIPHGSPWPIYGSVTLFILMSGAVATLNNWLPVWSLIPGFLMLISLFAFWFNTVIGENQRGIYNLAVDRSFRMGMMWFIFSEVMFFAAFFGALFYARNFSVPRIDSPVRSPDASFDSRRPVSPRMATPPPERST